MISKYIFRQCHELGVKEMELCEAYKLFFGTLVSEPRLKIINLLRKGRKNVTQIKEELNIDQTSVSHNLRRLKTCGFVKAEADGKYRYYKINEKTIRPLMETIERHMKQYCIHILRAMKGGGEYEN